MHRHLRARIDGGELTLQHLVAQTLFLRRENLNMRGEERNWTDSLVWHHAAHTVDLFIWLTGDPEPAMTCQSGPPHPKMGCLMDAAITLRAASGALMTLALSVNNDGPFGGFYRYICDGGTFHVFRDRMLASSGPSGSVSAVRMVSGIGPSVSRPSPAASLTS